MAQFEVEIRVMPRPSLLDPQGQAVEHALAALGFADVANVRLGRAITFRLDRLDRAAAEQDARRMCEQLLANPVTEDFSVTLDKTS